MAGDGKPEAGASKFATGGSIHLAERLEEAELIVGADANARVGNFKAQHRVGNRNHPQHHLALMGELDRVVQQIGQHLAQTPGVTAHMGKQPGLHQPQQPEPLAVGGFRQHLQGVRHHIAHIEVVHFKRQLARFDLGEIQDVIDNGQQQVAALADGLHKVVLVGIKGGFLQQAGHADDAIHGRADFVAHVG